MGLTNKAMAIYSRINKYEGNGKGQWITNLIFVPIFQKEDYVQNEDENSMSPNNVLLFCVVCTRILSVEINGGADSRTRAYVI